MLHGILAEKTPVITTQSKKELEEDMLLVKDAMEFEDISENPRENQDDEAAEDCEDEEEELLNIIILTKTINNKNKSKLVSCKKVFADHSYELYSRWR